MARRVSRLYRKRTENTMTTRRRRLRKSCETSPSATRPDTLPCFAFSRQLEAHVCEALEGQRPREGLCELYRGLRPTLMRLVWKCLDATRDSSLLALSASGISVFSAKKNWQNARKGVLQAALMYLASWQSRARGPARLVQSSMDKHAACLRRKIKLQRLLWRAWFCILVFACL